MRNNLRLNQNRGFSLLELLLSLGIIALIILMATRYFTTARNAQMIGATVQQIQGIRAAVSSMLATGVSPATITPTYLCTSGALPASYCTADNSAIITPWSPTGDTAITITIPASSTDGSLFTLKYTFANQATCTAAYNQFSADLINTSATDACAAGVASFKFKP